MGIKEFEDISVPVWKLAMNVAVGKVYRVFKNEKEFETVEANSASEAMEKCGVKKPFKIKSGAMDDVSMLSSKMLVQ